MVSIPATPIHLISSDRSTKACGLPSTSLLKAAEWRDKKPINSEIVEKPVHTEGCKNDAVIVEPVAEYTATKPRKVLIQRRRKSAASPVETGVLAPARNTQLNSNPINRLADKCSGNGAIRQFNSIVDEDIIQKGTGDNTSPDECPIRRNSYTGRMTGNGIGSMVSRDFEQRKSVVSLNTAMGMHHSTKQAKRASYIDRADELVTEFALEPAKTLDRLGSFLLNSKNVRERKAENRRAREIQQNYFMSSAITQPLKFFEPLTDEFYESASEGSDSYCSDSDIQCAGSATLPQSPETLPHDLQSSQVSYHRDSICESEIDPNTSPQLKQSSYQRSSSNSQTHPQQAFGRQLTMNVPHSPDVSMVKRHTGTTQAMNTFNFSPGIIHKRSASQSDAGRFFNNQISVDPNTPHVRVRRNPGGGRARPRSLCIANEYASTTSRGRRPSSFVSQSHPSSQQNSPQLPSATVAKLNSTCNQPSPRVFILPGQPQSLVAQTSDSAKSSAWHGGRQSPAETHVLENSHRYQHQVSVDQVSQRIFPAGNRMSTLPKVFRRMSLQPSVRSQAFPEQCQPMPLNLKSSTASLLPTKDKGSLTNLYRNNVSNNDVGIKPRVSFNSIAMFVSTFGAEQYDRTKFKEKKRVFRKAKRTPCQWEILEELLRFKIIEMFVHDESRKYTDLHLGNLQKEELLARENLIAKILVEKGCLKAASK